MTSQRTIQGDRAFSAFLHGKSAVVVGPAGYLRGQGRGPEFDAFDVVAKLNWGETLPREDYGRTDVLYKRLLKLGHADDVLVESYLAAGIRWILGIGTGRKGPESVAYLEGTLADRIPWYVDMRTRHTLRHQFGTSPLLGMVAIQHLLDHGARAVHVAGCDFYATGYAAEYGGKRYRGYMGRAEGVMSIKHDAPPQLRWLALLAARETRVTLDAELATILEPYAPPPLQPRRKRKAVAA